MNKFTKIAAPALIAALGMGAATSASAWEAPRHNAGHNTPMRNAEIRSEINGLRAQIDRAVARRMISQREAIGLRRDAAAVQQLYARYARGGLTNQEVRVLKSRVDHIQAALRMERRDRDGRRG